MALSSKHSLTYLPLAPTRMPRSRRRWRPSTSSRVSYLGPRCTSPLLTSPSDQVYSAEASVNDQEGLGGKLSSSDKKTLQTAIKEAKEWMEANTDASAEDLEEQQAEFSSTVQPIISSFYEGAAGGEQESYGSHDEL